MELVPPKQVAHSEEQLAHELMEVSRYFPAGQLYTQEFVEGFKARLVLQVMQSVGVDP